MLAFNIAVLVMLWSGDMLAFNIAVLVIGQCRALRTKLFFWESGVQFSILPNFTGYNFGQNGFYLCVAIDKYFKGIPGQAESSEIGVLRPPSGSGSVCGRLWQSPPTSR